MAISLKHTKVSAKSDGGDATLILPSDWNAAHSLTITANSIVYAVATDTIAELTMGASTFCARLAAGNIVAATVAEVLALLMPAPGAIGETTPGTIRSLNKEILEPTTVTLTALKCSGTIINNYGQAADAILTLPTCAAGLSFIAICGTTVANYWRFKCPVADADKIYLNGVAGSDDGYVEITSAAVGAAISFVAFQSEAANFNWLATTMAGTWVAG